MLKRFDARLWTMGAMVPMILAGCSTTAPTSTQATQPGQAAYTIQGGVAQPLAAANPCAECPSVVPFGAGLQNLATLTSHPVLDYSWYHNRGNFATFGWAPGFYANLQNFSYYPTAQGYWPYTFDHARAAYVPYSTVYGGRTVYPYLGLGGGMLGSYAGLGRRVDDRDGDDRAQAPAQQPTQQPAQGQDMSQTQGQAMGQAQGQTQGQGTGY